MKHDKQYLKMAKIWSENSHAKRMKVAALIVKDGRIISDGYNGTPSGFDNVCEFIPYEIKSHPLLEDIEVDTNGVVYKNGKSVSIYYHSSKKYLVCTVNRKQKRIHRLVMETFVKNTDPSFYTQVNHIDWDTSNNKLVNLEWCSNTYNAIHRDSRADKTSKYPGVSRDKHRNKWVSRNRTFDDEYKAYQYYLSQTDNRHFTSIKAKMKTKSHVLHAEANAITKIAKSTNSSEGATIYTLVLPCIDCAKLIIQSGIIRVVYCQDYRNKDGLQILKQAKIQVDKIQIEC